MAETDRPLGCHPPRLLAPPVKPPDGKRVTGADSGAFVHADGPLAEQLCQARLIGLTPARAEELCRVHRHHPPDDCPVHLAALLLLDHIHQQ